MTTPQEFAEQLRAHQAHMEAVPVAMALARSYAAGDAGADVLVPPAVQTLVAEVDRLTQVEKNLRDEMREQQSGFQREARYIAAEATAQASGRQS